MSDDGDELLTGKQEAFCQAVLELDSLAAAYRSAYNVASTTTPAVVWNEASLLANNPKIAARIRELRNAAAAVSCIPPAAELLRQLYDLASADPSELEYRPACRYCWGIDFRWQWRDEAEFVGELARALDDRRAPTAGDDSGGYGYSRARAPNPLCPHCAGSGSEQTYVADVTRLSQKGRRLFKCLDRSGRPVMHDQMHARDQLHKLLGLYKDDATGVARAAAAGAVVGGAAVATLTDNMTADKAARMYRQLIDGT